MFMTCRTARGAFSSGVHESADTVTVQRLAAGFTARGHRFVAVEHHGHGRSTGRRGLVESWDKLLSHASEFVQSLMQTHDNEKFVVVGHSMGGAVAAYISSPLRRRFSSRFLGVILVAPSLTGPTPNWVTQTALAGLCSIWSAAPVGPPEHPEEYDTCSGLDLNYRGNMQVNQVQDRRRRREGCIGMIAALPCEPPMTVHRMQISMIHVERTSLDTGARACTPPEKRRLLCWKIRPIPLTVFLKNPTFGCMAARLLAGAHVQGLCGPLRPRRQ